MQLFFRKNMLWIVFVILFWIIFLFCLIVTIVSLYAFTKMFGRRYDGNPYVHYFTAEDFEGLRAQPFSFYSDGSKLNGYIYRSDLWQGPSKGLIVFSHGFGAGHLAYTTEINYFAKNGYKILAFDNTGCVKSEGDSIKGFDQGVKDLIAAVQAVSQSAALGGEKIYLIGHSWGAFSVMNALPLCKNVCGAVALCGFIGCSEIMSQKIFGGFIFARKLSEAVFRLCNRAVFKKKANFNSIRSLKTIERPVLLLYGMRDNTVLWKYNGKKIFDNLKSNSKIRFLAYPEKGHNVYLTCSAERIMQKSFGDISKNVKKNKSIAAEAYAAIDYRAITEEDESVMSEIIDFIERVE